MTIQAPEDTIEWFHWVFLAQLIGMLEHVEQHMALLMDGVGVMATTTDTTTTMSNPLAYAKFMTVTKRKAAATSWEK